MKRFIAPLLVTATLSLLCTGCLFQHTNDDSSIRPETAIGTRATIMMPGQGPAPMTVFGQPTGGAAAGSGSASSSGSSTSQKGAQTSSGSSSGSRSSTGSGSSSGTAPGTSSGSRTSSGAGLPTPGSDDGMSMLGGTVGEGDASSQIRSTPIIGPILSLVGYPFFVFRSNEEKADHVAAQRADEYAAKQQTGRPIPRSADDAERMRIESENTHIREQLNRKKAARGPATISDELAALERSLGTSRSSESRTPTPEIREGLDRNHDGRPDLWAYREAGQSREELDDDHDGRPDRILFYDDQKRLERSEEDLDYDGRFETFTHYIDGEISRRRADSDGDGAPDSWSFYSAGELVRHEVDRDKDGFRDLILVYEAGSLVREEDDRNRDGRPDMVSVYREGAVIEKHDDMDFDGLPDITSYYEGGKLVRRTVSSEGALEPWQGGSGS
jgi:hypothetical protein